MLGFLVMRRFTCKTHVEQLFHVSNLMNDNYPLSYYPRIFYIHCPGCVHIVKQKVIGYGELFYVEMAVAVAYRPKIMQFGYRHLKRNILLRLSFF